MGDIQFYNHVILFVGGAIAMDPACCCEEAFDPCAPDCTSCATLTIDSYSDTMFEVCSDDLCAGPPAGLDDLCADPDSTDPWDGTFSCIELRGTWELLSTALCTNGMRLSERCIIRETETNCEFELYLYVFCADGTDILLWKGTSTAGILGPYTREDGCSANPATISLTRTPA